MNNKRIYVIAVTIAIILAVALIERCNGARNDNEHSAIAKTQNHPYGDLLKVRHPAQKNSIFREYNGFELLFNPENHTPDYVAWELLESETDGPGKRSNAFWKDETLKGCPASSDYSRSGYDRGHLCPAADMKWDNDAMRECFVMSNMAPQNHSLNAYAWASLENKCRQWARRDSALIIVAGPVYEASDTKRIGNEGVRVPSAFFKVILAPYLTSPRAIGFIYPNTPAPGKMENYAMSVRDVENITGLDFFYNLPDSLENSIETSLPLKEWFHAISSRP